MGVYIKGITVQMLRDAPLEAVEELLASGDMVEVPKPHGKLVEFIEVATIDDEDSGTELVNLGDVFTAYGKMLKAKPVIEAEGE